MTHLNPVSAVRWLERVPQSDGIVTHRNVETLIGRLVTDPLLRRRFADSQADVLREFQEQGYELSAIEIDALAATADGAIQSFSDSIDPRIRKADTGSVRKKRGSMREGTIARNDGRMVGFADYGSADHVAVVWCHGGPGSRIEPSWVFEAASHAGMRLIGIDRPGYGRSTPQPGRTIGGWVPDAIAVVDHLGIDRFMVIGVSTGGAYALALASQSSRVSAAVACCAVSDMRWQAGKAMNVSCHPVWNARSREEAIAIVTGLFGEHGEQILAADGLAAADPSDVAVFADPAFLAWWTRAAVPDMFTHGVAGYVDDRIADQDGWYSFDVGRITCPVVVLHGEADGLMPVANAHHTAAIVPGASLKTVAGLGHFSILTKAVGVMTELLPATAVAR